MMNAFPSFAAALASDYVACYAFLCGGPGPDDRAIFFIWPDTMLAIVIAVLGRTAATRVIYMNRPDFPWGWHS